jgi:anion-transporting  ArsA/GET3 family ATPase
MVKLYDLHQTGRYDLLVLDTPPTTNALDFLEAPQRVADAVDSPAVQWFIRPYMTAGRLSLKLVGRGGAFVLRRLARFVGSEFLEEVARFLVEINTMLGGFRERAEQVATLLRDPGAAFVLVTSAEPVAIDEAIFFHQRLRKQSFPFAGFVVNRVHVRGGPTPELRQVGRLLSGCETLETLLPEEIDRVATAMQVTYEEFQRLADVDEREVARLVERCGRDAFYVKVPFFENDLHDIRGLLALGRHLFAVDCSACGSDLTSIDRDCCS